MGSGLSGEYVQNQGGTVNNFDSQYFFEVSLLPRRQFIVKDRRVVLSWLSEVDQFRNLALTYVVGRRRHVQLLSQRTYYTGACRLCQIGQLLQRIRN